MDINQLLGASTATTQNGKGVGKKELGQEDFMKLLVAQMKNQDPSNPSDNAQFLSQISQFTMVDGIEDLGNSFDNIAGSFFTNQAMSASQLVGRQVLSESNTGWLQENQSLDGMIEVPEFTEALNIQVRDSAGRLVKTLDSRTFGAGPHAFSWNGLNEQDEVQPFGEYSILATALVNGKQQGLPVQLYNTVESITLNRAGNHVELQLDNNQSVSFTGINQYR